ncbi:MAG: hypothetical protein FJZ01_07560 [Candidatus Sericytochromatia bacterium]|nr:hypothetical protein [Candidatus Tanganyikabacteria bacterium]
MKDAAENLLALAIGGGAALPEPHRATLGPQLLALAQALLHLAIAAEKGCLDDTGRRDLEVRLDGFRSVVRIAHDAGAIPSGQVAVWTERLDAFARAAAEPTAPSPPRRAFEDLLALDDRGVQRLLREIDLRELLLALKGSDEAMHDRIFQNVSTRMGKMLRDEMTYMGPVRKSDVEEARRKIAAVACDLEDRGEIILVGAGEELVT